MKKLKANTRGYLMIEVAVSTAILGVLLSGTVAVIADARSRATKASYRATAVAHAQSGLNELVSTPIDWEDKWGGETSTEKYVLIGESNFPMIQSILDNDYLRDEHAYSGEEYQVASYPKLLSDDSIQERWVAVKHLVWSGKDVNSEDQAHINWVYNRGIRRNRVE